MGALLELRYGLKITTVTECSTDMRQNDEGARGLAGKLLAGFSIIPSRRIPILCGTKIYDIRIYKSISHR